MSMRASELIRNSLLALVLLSSGLLPATAWSHGGVGIDADPCRVRIGPHLVHFTAYQPELTGSTDYCNTIPKAGPAIIVFDYEGKALRNMTVEFEVTREPQGSRVFHQPASTHPNGSFNSQVDFAEAGQYLVHITLVNGNEKVDKHIALTVGPAGGFPTKTLIIVLTLLLAASYLFYLSNAGFKSAVDSIILRKKDV